jgi:hypothetical protein
MKISISDDGELVNIELTRDNYHLIWRALYATGHFIGNKDFYAVSGFTTLDALQLCDQLGENFDVALRPN